MSRSIIVLIMLLILPTAWAVDGVGWDQLSAEQQKLLQPHAERWPSLAPEQQQRLKKRVRTLAEYEPG